MKTTKKVMIPLLDSYRPDLLRRKIKNLYQERFEKLFFSLFDFKGTLNAEERVVVLKQLWESGSFAVTRSPAPLAQFEDEMDLTFTKYAVDAYDYNMQPLYFHNAPLQAARAVSMKKHRIGKDGVIVYLNEYARLHVNQGARNVAERYITQIVNAKMTQATNILTHKLPFVVPTEEDAYDSYVEMLRQVFSDKPAVFVPASFKGNEPKALQLNTPYIVDKLEAYARQLENMYMEELGIDTAAPVASGQDRLLLDEVNANNAKINNFRSSMIETLKEGFADVETLFGRKIEVEYRAPQSLSLHEDETNVEEGNEEGGNEL